MESAWYIKGVFGNSEVSQAKGYQSNYVLCGKMSICLPDLEKKDQLIGVIRVLAGGGVVSADKTALQFSTPSPRNPSQGYTPQSTYRARGEVGGVCTWSLSWSGAYTTTFYVLVIRVKGGGRSRFQGEPPWLHL